MARPNDPQKDPISALYFQVYCEACGAALYADEVKGSGGRVVCARCLADEAAKLQGKGRGLLQAPAEVPFLGMSLFQFLLVVLILGVIVGAVVPTLLRIKDKAEQDALEIKFLTTQDPAMRDLAMGLLTTPGEVGQATDLLSSLENTSLALVIQRLAETAGIGSEDMPKFRAELMKHQEFDTPESQAGWVLQVVERWKEKLRPNLDVIPQDPLPPEK